MSEPTAFRPAYHGLPPGTRLNGIYEIDATIGTGGMGEVYRGHEIQTGVPVAIKLLLPDMAENEAALALFRREASALHNLPHDAIVRYFLFTVEPVLQRPYLAMEFVDGRSLSDILDGGPLTFEALVNLMRRVASGLQAAHERGIIHRDVSPDNIIVPQGDVTRAKLIDFGIARQTQVSDATIIGSGFAGKHNYVSPEQVGLFGNEVTAKSDIYSLGLVLFHALTGRKLDMGGTQFELVEKRRRVPDLGAVDMRIRPLLEQMLQPDPARRPASMAEIANWTPGAAMPPRGRATPERAAAVAPAETRTGRRAGRLAAASLVAVALLAGGGYAFYAFVWSMPDVATSPPPRLGQTPPVNTAKAPPTEPAPQVAAPVASPAALPSAPPPALPVGPGRTDGVRAFIDQYDGGNCFLVTPVAVTRTAAVLEGFGASTSAFDTFSRSFQHEQGFQPSLSVRQVTKAQCPAIAFLNELRGSRGRVPRINLTTTSVRNGDTLTGSVDNIANRVVDLLLVSETGQVQNVSYALKQGTDAYSFALPIQRGDGGAGPQLLVAVAGTRLLDSLRQPRPVAADQFFLQAASEAQRGNITLTSAVRYVQLEK